MIPGGKVCRNSKLCYLVLFMSLSYCPCVPITLYRSSKRRKLTEFPKVFRSLEAANSNLPFPPRKAFEKAKRKNKRVSEDHSWYL